MKYVIGIDLGTSAVKVLLVNEMGEVCHEVTKPYPLIHEKVGFSEQDPEQWVTQTIQALTELVKSSGIAPSSVEGISFSGQMHGLVLLDRHFQVLRNAILWNDTRTTEQCRQIEQTLGDKLHTLTKNPALEGFTLPKLLWVKAYEPELMTRAAYFVLPKDYLRLRLSGTLHCEYSDAAGTLLLNVTEKQWSSEICEAFDLNERLCPPLVASHEVVGTLLPEVATATGLSEQTKVIAGGADNACGALGAGIIEPGKTLCSIGTSGVVLSYEENKEREFRGNVHFFNHVVIDAYYTMGVTLAAGFSLDWFKRTFAPTVSFEELLEHIGDIPAGSNGLLFTPYLVGERTPHADATIRGSFIGMDASHTRDHFTRSVVEGITFSLRESVDIFREAGKTIHSIVSIGGGAKNDQWLQIQADIFNAEIVKLQNEQGPGMGAAMLAAYGCGWFQSLKECVEVFIRPSHTFKPNKVNADRYDQLFEQYRQIYRQTKVLNEELQAFRK